MKRCAIVQLEAVHEDFIPSVIYLLNLNNYRPTIHLPKRSIEAKGNAFDMVNDLHYDLDVHEFNSRADWAVTQNKIKNNKEYDFVLVNTYQQKKLIKWFLELEKPLLAIVHNTSMFRRSDYYEDSLKKDDIYYLTLAYHVAIKLRSVIGIDKTNIGHFIPFYLSDKGKDPLALLPNDGRINIGIIGGIQFKSRNLTGIIKNLEKITNKEIKNKIKFLVCGGGRDRVEFEQLVEEKNLSDYFDFAPKNKESGFVEYEDYRNYVLKSQYLISLFPENTHRYLAIKISSITYNSLGYNTPILMDKVADMIYDIPCVHYDINNFEDELLKLIRMNQQDYFNLKKDLEEYRVHCVVQGAEMFKKGIKHILKDN